MHKFQAIFLIVYLIGVPVLAQNREAEIVDNFENVCTKSSVDFADIDGKATELKLRILKEGVSDVGEGRSSKFKVWQLRGSAGIYELMVSEFASEFSTKTTCRISAPNAKGSEVRKIVVSKLNLPAPDIERLASVDFKDKIIDWKVSLKREDVRISLIHPSDESLGVDLSLTKTSNGKPELASQTRETSPVACTLQIIQDGEIVLPEVSEKFLAFKLAARDFKINVSPLACNPSVVLTGQHQVEYLTQTPLVFSTGNYWIAGDTEHADMLNSAAGLGNVRTVLEEEIGYAGTDVQWAREQYRKACGALGYCPTPAKTYATTWPFLDPETKENRGFAEFKRFDQYRSLGQVSGSVILAVVYLNWKTISKGSKWNEKRLYLLKPEILVLDFR